MAAYLDINNTWFDTGIHLTTNSKMKMKFAFVNMDYRQYHTIVGEIYYQTSYWQEKASCFAFTVTGTTSKSLQCTVGGYNKDGFYSNIELDTIYNIELSTSDAVLKDVSGNILASESFTSNFISSYTCMINTDASHYASARMQFYGLEIYDNNVLTHNFVPDIDGQGHGCLHDTITGIYINANNPSAVEYVQLGWDVDKKSLSFTDEGSEETVTITGNENSWTATASDERITVTPDSGTAAVTEFTVELPTNYGNQRTGTISLSNGVDDDITISVSQERGLILRKTNIYRNGNIIN